MSVRSVVLEVIQAYLCLTDKGHKWAEETAGYNQVQCEYCNVIVRIQELPKEQRRQFD